MHRILDILAIIVSIFIVLVVMSILFPARADERCMPVDPAGLIWTVQGYSLAQGDGHLTIPHKNVVYDDGPIRVCMPPEGLLKLYLPKKSWPQFASFLYGQGLRKDNTESFTLVHGEYAWISDFNYKDASGTHCCGWNDCVEIDPSHATEKKDGFHYQDRIIDKRAVYQSRDGKAWLCRFNKCLFLPSGG